MYLTSAETIPIHKNSVQRFGGLNETFGCSVEEYSEGMNLSARYYPALSTRPSRRAVRQIRGLNGMYHLNGILLVRGKTVEYQPEEGETVCLENAVTDTAKKMAGIGTKIVIFPDRVAFDTADGTLSPLDCYWSSRQVEQVVWQACDVEGTVYSPRSIGTTEPSGVEDGYVFLKLTGEDGGAELEIYSGEGSSVGWTTPTLGYCRISATGIGQGIAQYDTVTIQGTAKRVLKYLSPDLSGDVIVYGCGTDWLVVPATNATPKEFYYGVFTQSTDSSGGNTVAWTGNWETLMQTSSGWQGDGTTQSWTLPTSENEVTVERRVPQMDWIVENENRIWGCSSAENVIYACKLGDPTNWYSYRGIAADSYAVTVGTEGRFTGATSCMGYVLFFKENVLHKIYGSRPSDYQTVTLRCRGVMEGAGNSVCVMDEVVYYLSRDGVMVWDGSFPSCISSWLDMGDFVEAREVAAGWLKGKYYLRWRQSDSRVRLLSYDSVHHFWHEEDDVGQQLLSSGRQLYLWDGQTLWAEEPTRESNGTKEEECASVEFCWTTGEIGWDAPEEKYLTSVVLRLDALCSTRLCVQVSYNGEAWEELWNNTIKENHLRLEIPCIPHRYDTVRFRLSGKGQFILHSILRRYNAAVGKGR